MGRRYAGPIALPQLLMGMLTLQLPCCGQSSKNTHCKEREENDYKYTEAMKSVNTFKENSK